VIPPAFRVEFFVEFHWDNLRSRATLVPVMSRFLDVLFSPAEFQALSKRDLSETTCVVFDILRATTSMIAALDAGALAILPVADIPEALDRKLQFPDALLAGERHGLRIGSDLASGTEFDFGNSPREFTAERVRGRRIIMTTTNGTRALRAVRSAACVYPAAFLNLGAVAGRLLQNPPARLVLVCGGTYEEASLEDTLAAGALCEWIWGCYADGHVTDAARMSLELHRQLGLDLAQSMQMARNGRRLLHHAELHADVPFSIRKDRVDFVAVLEADDHVRRQSSSVEASSTDPGRLAS
jgi:2-phosphosulfolactate phosphatase